MFHSASLKLGLERAVMSQNREQNEENDDGAKTSKKSNREAQAKEIDQLLKKGAYDVFRDDDDKEAERFMETDIDQLLEHSSKTVSYDATATSSLGNGLGSFSKASFVASTDDGAKDVDLDDPDFWSKAVGLDAPPDEIPDDIAAMIDDGVKRSRKQVEQYDPYAESSTAEQIKKEQQELERMLEEEERESHAEKNVKPRKGKEEKRKVVRDGVGNKSENSKHESSQFSTKAVPKLSKDIKPKTGKSRKRALALRRAENENPIIEQFKQAWEISQRNRATAAAIRFGFGRFCKLRNESNLSSLPLQDIEIFVRSYCYQLSLQTAVTLLKLLRNGYDPTKVRALVRDWLGVTCSQEVDWICDSVRCALEFQVEVESYRSFLRVPVTLTESTYIEDLRYGAGLRALRRIALLARLNGIITECIEDIIVFVGQEELEKRGCNVEEFDKLDIDQKSRFFTTEELMFAVGTRMRKLEFKYPALWWDRSCDIALIVGTFVHGLSNYESMRRDKTLPFGEKISRFCKYDPASKEATQRFRSLSEATRKVFEDALEAARIKAELEVQAAVAAAAKAALQREEDAALLRKGGLEAEGAVRNMPETQVDDAFEFDGTDTHFVTLPRMHENIRAAAQSFKSSVIVEGILHDEDNIEFARLDEDVESTNGRGQTSRIKEHHLLPVPDSRILDFRFMRLLHEIETSGQGDIQETNVSEFWELSKNIGINIKVRDAIFPKVDDDAMEIINEYSGIGLSATQCGISHRTLNDGSDYSFGSASNQISQLAYGTDAPRYLRALCVPMNVTRFAISGLLYSDFPNVKALMISERLRYFGKEDVTCTTVSNSNNDYISVENTKIRDGDHGSVGQSRTTAPNITDESWMHSSSRPTIIAPIDPIETIPDVFRSNTTLRACVCVAVGFYGFPLPTQSNLDISLWEYTYSENNSTSTELLDLPKFRAIIMKLDSTIDVPDIDALQLYVETVLLPHCLRLCVYGNGPCTRNARGSHGDYETAFGLSTHPEPSLPRPSPLPDPCLRVQEHSLEAIGFANAILRRVRLLRSCVYICSLECEISVTTLAAKAKSMVMCCSLHEMPIWWCPWIHDIALLLHSATNGLLSLIRGRTDHPIFSTRAIENFLHSKVASDKSMFHITDNLDNENVTNWCERQATTFPTLYQLERRLGLFCSELTVDVSDERRFDYIPMFDHGGWPRK
jgi:hypothetical protein